MAHDSQYFSDGAAYERQMGRWTRAAGTFFLDWVAAPSGARWLDIGCGTGVFTELVVDRCFPATVVAVDPAVAQIDLAHKKPIAQRADFRVADAQTLPFSDGAFSVVVSALVINFIPDRPRALAEMRRVCQPGGVIASYVWDLAAHRNPNSLIRIELNRVGAKPAPVPGTEDSRLDALTSLFAGAKLTDISTKTIDVTMSFSDFDEYWQSQTPSFSPMGKIIAALSQTDREKLIESVRSRVPAGADGSITCSARANAIKARVPA